MEYHGISPWKCRFVPLSLRPVTALDTVFTTEEKMRRRIHRRRRLLETVAEVVPGEMALKMGCKSLKDGESNPENFGPDHKGPILRGKIKINQGI